MMLRLKFHNAIVAILSMIVLELLAYVVKKSLCYGVEGDICNGKLVINNTKV